MKKGWKSIIASLILGCILAVAAASAAQAQSEDLTIHLTHPNEGETFYAGPSSMLYMVPITGSVKSGSFSADQVSVGIAIYQDSSLVLNLAIAPDADGSFEAFAKVNPGSYSQEFAAEFITCGDVCHFNLLTQFQRKEWIPSLDLPQGPMLLVVTATDPAGRVTSVKRNIIVDRSAYAIVPVQVILVENSQQSVENIPIEATTWLYMWRSRTGNGATDSEGLAHVRVEALSQAPTSYRFQVKPLVVNGVFYESITPVDIVLPPSASIGPLVTLQVRARLGTIHGQFNGGIPSSQVQIWAIHLPDGDARTAPVSPDGSFIFENIPIGKYVVTADQEFLASQGFMAPEESIDLSQSISADVALNLLPIEGYSLQGNVMDMDGNRLPFAWVSVEKVDIVEAVMPNSGRYALYGQSLQKITLVANAPGYYSQARVTDLTRDDIIGLDFKLVRRPETTSLPWGKGEIIVSPETRISLSGKHIFLERGWLWGQNYEDDPIIIQSGRMEINLSSGIFALEAVPGEPAWFYLFDGSGSVSTYEESNANPIQAGQMIALDENLQLSVVPFDPVVVKAFRSNIRLSVPTTLQPTIKAQLSNRLALIGIDMAKLITYITYTLILASIILLPVMAAYRWLRQRMIIIDSKRK